MNAYEAKKAARIDRLRARAEKLGAESAARIAGARATADRIPFGQPILVGHHSERRHRRDLDRIDGGFRKGFALAREAQDVERRADRAESSTVISSDDPDALPKLRERLAEMTARGDGIKSANKLLRASAFPHSAETIRKVAELVGWTPDKAASTLGILHSMGQRLIGTTNGSAERRRLEGRIAQFEARAAAPAKPPETIGPVTIEERDNRVRVIFPDKPSQFHRTWLKNAGFRWAPSEGVWQRTPCAAAWDVARAVAKEIAQAETMRALVEDRPDACDGCGKVASVGANDRQAWTCYSCGRINLRDARAVNA